MHLDTKKYETARPQCNPAAIFLALLSRYCRWVRPYKAHNTTGSSLVSMVYCINARNARSIMPWPPPVSDNERQPCDSCGTSVFVRVPAAGTAKTGRLKHMLNGKLIPNLLAKHLEFVPSEEEPFSRVHVVKEWALPVTSLLNSLKRVVWKFLLVTFRHLHH